MDKEIEEMQFLGVFGLIKEALHMLARHAKLLLSITILLLFPLVLVELCHSFFTNPIINRILVDQFLIGAEERVGDAADASKTEKDLRLEWIKLLVFFLGYLLFLLAFSLLSISALVYTVASIYVEKEVGFKKTLKAIPRICWRLLLTLFWGFITIFAFNFLLILVSIGFITLLALIKISPAVSTVFCLLVYFGIHIYLSLWWHVANVISVMEDKYGIGALRKSLNLVRGRILVGYALVFISFIFTTILASVFSRKVLIGGSNLAARIWYTILLVIALTFVNLVAILVHTLFYFSCKSYHHESIDRLALSDQLDGYLGEYMPLKDPSIPMEDFEA